MSEDENRALFASAVAHQQAGRASEAIHDYALLLARNPRVIPALNNLGLLLIQEGRFDEAEKKFRAALGLRPDYAEALSNLSVVLKQQHRIDEALECLQRSLALQPDNVETLINLGETLFETARYGEALEVYERASVLRPTDFRVHKGRGMSLPYVNRVEEAIAALGEALRLKPDSVESRAGLVRYKQMICDWSDGDVHERILVEALRAGRHGIEPFLALTLPTSAHEQQVCAERFTGAHGYRQRPAAARPAFRHEKIRVAYLSGDLRQHPVANLMVEIFERHDRNKVEVTAYSIGPDDGTPMRRRLVAAFDRFVDAETWSAAQLAAQIGADGVDILVDLAGHSQRNRTAALAERPAPIQVNFLGITATSGMPFMDYIIVDHVVVPPENAPYFTENVVYLPSCVQANSRREVSPVTPTRKSAGLPEEGFVFCCFNRLSKVTPQTFAVWMRLLKQVPGSVLWLVDDFAAAVANLRRAAADHGVDPARLVFAPRQDYGDYLAQYRIADLFLDTQPYNAHTTLSDALAVGLPAITARGDTFVSRLGASILTSVGLPELVTANMQDYEQLALSLANDPAQLAHLRAKLVGNLATTPLFDSTAFARNLERAYAEMRRIYLAGSPPQVIDLA